MEWLENPMLREKRWIAQLGEHTITTPGTFFEAIADAMKLHRLDDSRAECSVRYGAGHYGDAWRACFAFDPETKRCSACYVFKVALGGESLLTLSEVHATRAASELLRRNMSPHVAAFYAALKPAASGIQSGKMRTADEGVLVIEDIPGPAGVGKSMTLDKFLKHAREAPLSVTRDDLASILFQVLWTLMALQVHRVGFVHGDLQNLNNVLVTSWDDADHYYEMIDAEGVMTMFCLPKQRFRAVLIDYGFAWYKSLKVSTNWQRNWERFLRVAGSAMEAGDADILREFVNDAGRPLTARFQIVSPVYDVFCFVHAFLDGLTDHKLVDLLDVPGKIQAQVLQPTYTPDTYTFASRPSLTPNAYEFFALSSLAEATKRYGGFVMFILLKYCAEWIVNTPTSRVRGAFVVNDRHGHAQIVESLEDVFARLRDRVGRQRD